MKFLQRKGKLIRAAGAALSLGALLMMLVASVLPWGNLGVETKIGIIPVTLDADVYEYGIDYEANLSGAGLFSGANIPSKMADKKVFLTGLGGFQETIGFVKGSSKEKTVSATSYTWPPPRNGTAETRITMLLGTIPWWPVGLAQDAAISVELTAAVNVSELRIAKVVFEVHRIVDGADRYKVVYESSPGVVLTKVGDKKTVWGKVTVDEDFGNFTLVSKVQLELKDTFGNTNKRQDGSFYELVPPPSEVRLWTMGADKTARIGMMMAAFPMSIAAVAVLAAGSVLALIGNIRERAARWAWMLCMTGALLALLSIVFYVLGIGALIELTGYGEWFSWNPQFYLAVGGACLSPVPAILLYMTRPPPPPEKKDGPGAVKGQTGDKGLEAKIGKDLPPTPTGKAATGSQPPTNKVIK